MTDKKDPPECKMQFGIVLFNPASKPTLKAIWREDFWDRHPALHTTGKVIIAAVCMVFSSVVSVLSKTPVALLVGMVFGFMWHDWRLPSFNNIEREEAL